MKKIICAVISLLMVLSLAACGAKNETAVPSASGDTKTEETKTEEKEAVEKKEKDGTMTVIANPMVEFASLDEINEKAGTNLVHPGVMGITDEKFFVINDTVAEYLFNVNGVRYTFRSAPTTDDISGVYGENGLALDGMEGDVITETGECRLARWFNTEGQFTLCTDIAVDADIFKGIVDELTALTNPRHIDRESAYAAFDGEYQDEYSQRANAIAVSHGDCVNIVIVWSDSASSLVRWTMNAVLGEDGLLNYSDCVKEMITTDADGKETAELLYENGEGFFSADGSGKLFWNGAADEDCVECVFVKLEE